MRPSWCSCALQTDGHQVLVDCGTGKVSSTEAALGARVQRSVARMLEVLRPVHPMQEG